jgi:uncharacterized cupin superfamily protein
VTPEASLGDGVPTEAGWFVVGLRDTPWETDRLRSQTSPGGEGAAHLDQIGLALYRPEPGGAMSTYHHEAGQEDFLVPAGRPMLLVEEVERPLARWDLVHCPPRTPHTIVNRAEEVALIFAVGARIERGSARHPRSELARRHGVEGLGDLAADAYGDIVARPGPAPELPELSAGWASATRTPASIPRRRQATTGDHASSRSNEGTQTAEMAAWIEQAARVPGWR